MITTAGKNPSGLKTTAFALSLVGGVLILINGLMSFMMVYYFSSDFGWMWDMMNGFFGMMGGMMGGFSYTSGPFLGLMIVGLICGIIVTLGAVMLNSQSAARRSWGIVILIFSIVSFVGMGGFFIGALLGIAGGAIALA